LFDGFRGAGTGVSQPGSGLGDEGFHLVHFQISPPSLLVFFGRLGPFAKERFGQEGQVFASVEKIHNLHGKVETGSGDFPNPRGPISQHYNDRGQSHPPPQGFGPDQRAELFGGEETGNVSGGVGVPERVSLLLGALLGKDAAQLGFARSGGAILLLAGAILQFLRDHRHTRAIDAGVENPGWLDRLGRNTLVGMGRDLRGFQVDHALNLPALHFQSRIGFEVGAGRFIAGSHRPGPAHHFGHAGRIPVDEPHRRGQRKTAPAFFPGPDAAR